MFLRRWHPFYAFVRRGGAIDTGGIYEICQESDDYAIDKGGMNMLIFVYKQCYIEWLYSYMLKGFFCYENCHWK